MDLGRMKTDTGDGGDTFGELISGRVRGEAKVGIIEAELEDIHP